MDAFNEIHPSHTLFPLYGRKTPISLLRCTDSGLHLYVSEVSWLTNLTQSLRVSPDSQNEPVKFMLLKVLYKTVYVLLKNSDVTHLPLGTTNTFIASAAAWKAEQDMNNHFLALFVQL